MIVQFAKLGVSPSTSWVVSHQSWVAQDCVYAHVPAPGTLPLTFRFSFALSDVCVCTALCSVMAVEAREAEGIGAAVVVNLVHREFGERVSCLCIISWSSPAGCNTFNVFLHATNNAKAI